MLFYRGMKNQIPSVKEFYALGTINSLQVYGRKSVKAIEEAMKRVNDIDDKMSVFKEDSDITKINKNAGGLPQEVSEYTFYVMKKSMEYSELSKGAFDPTIRPVVALWGINTDNARIPSENEIKEELTLVNYKDIILNEANNFVSLRNKGQALDVGGIAKGFALILERGTPQKMKL